jgi:fucose 4-O-acetylase-like acetyltransferase
MASRSYQQLSIEILEAICGCFCFFELSKAIENKKVCKYISFLGENTLMILCIHHLDGIWMNIWRYENIITISTVRIICDIIVLIAVLYLKSIIFKLRHKY